MTKPFLKVERDGHVAVLTFDRPEKLNAWAWGPTNELCAAADEIRFDRSVRAVVLRGEGRAFCAGEDLKPETDDVEERHPGRSGAEKALLAYERATYLFERWGVVDQLPQPVIAAIHGYCLGAGLEIAMLADIRIAATDAVFALPQVTLGTQIVGGAELPAALASVPLATLVDTKSAVRPQVVAFAAETCSPANDVKSIYPKQAAKLSALFAKHNIDEFVPPAAGQMGWALMVRAPYVNGVHQPKSPGRMVP